MQRRISIAILGTVAAALVLAGLGTILLERTGARNDTLTSLRSVVVNRMVANPAAFAGGGEPTPSEAVLTVGWGGINRIDLEPAACADPECDADHGYEGTMTGDDIALRISAAADGDDALSQALAFARDLSAAIGQG